MASLSGRKKCVASLASCRYLYYSFECSQTEHSKAEVSKVSVFRPRPRALGVMLLANTPRQDERERKAKVWGGGEQSLR